MSATVRYIGARRQLTVESSQEAGVDRDRIELIADNLVKEQE